jgi:ribosomal protein L7/L12
MARIYVKRGTVEAVKFIRKQTGCGLQEAFNKVRFLRDKN